MGPAPCASQGVCHCKGGTGSGGRWGPRWDFSPLLTVLFFPAEGSCSPRGAVTPRSPALCAFPQAAMALQLMVLYFSTKTFCKSPTRCERCLWSVAAPAPLHSWCWHPQRTCSVPLPRPMRPQPPAKEFSQRPVQVFATHTPSPPSRGLAARFYPFQGRESLRSLISIAAFEGIYKLRPSPLRLL